jgi:hypothetical protein
VYKNDRITFERINAMSWTTGNYAGPGAAYLVQAATWIQS